MGIVCTYCNYVHSLVLFFLLLHLNPIDKKYCAITTYASIFASAQMGAIMGKKAL